ncbi:MAG: hypothetical protein KGM15_08040 [Pseudomonadota bacterium]|nr:hypothetical protein [Pseudomonadota bacterium]
MKPAIAQIACVAGDVAANLQRHLCSCEQAQHRLIDRLLLPELSLTDYLSAPDCGALALSVDAAPLRACMDAAGPMAVSFGFIERGEDGCGFNTKVLVGARRRLGFHRELNLPTYGNLAEG